WRIGNIGRPDADQPWRMPDTSRSLLSADPEQFEHCWKETDSSDSEQELFFLITTGMTRFPMPVVLTGGRTKITGEAALKNLLWIRPQEFDDRGRVLIPNAAKSQVVVDMRFNKQLGHTESHLAFLSPRYPFED